MRHFWMALVLGISMSGCAVASDEETPEASNPSSVPAFSKFQNGEQQRDRGSSVSSKVGVENGTITNDRALPSGGRLDVPDLVVDIPGVIPEQE